MDDDVEVNEAERIGVNSVVVAMVERRNSLLVVSSSLWNQVVGCMFPLLCYILRRFCTILSMVSSR